MRSGRGSRGTGRHRAWLPVVVVGAFVAGGTAGASHAPSEVRSHLDPGFGSGGVVVLPAAGPRVSDVLATAGGGAVVAASTEDHRLLLVRVAADGTPVWTTDLGLTGVLESFALAEQPDGRLLVGLRTADGPSVARVDAGALDPSFGDGGVATIPEIAEPGSLAPTADGVVIGGFGPTPGATTLDSSGALVRLTGDGGLDPSFADAGVFWAPDAADAHVGAFVALAVDGDDLVALAHEHGYPADALVRLDASGALDPALSGDGVAPVGPGAVDLALHPDGRMSVLRVPSSTTVIERYLPDGARDPALNGSGAVIVGRFDGPQMADFALDVAGRYVAAGQQQVGRILASGAPDPWFTTGAAPEGAGPHTIPLGAGRFADLRAIAALPHGRILAAGVVRSVETQAATHLLLTRLDALPTTATTAAGWAASSWQALDGAARGAPALVAVADSTTEILVRGLDDRLWVRRVGADPTPWRSTEGVLSAPPAGAVAPDGRRAVAVRGSDGAIWFGWLANGGFSGWQALGGRSIGAPAVAVTTQGQVVVAVRGSDDRLWLRRSTGAGWGSWTPIGSTLRDAPALRSLPGGVLEVLVRGADDSLWILGIDPSVAWRRVPSGLTAAPAGVGSTAGPAEVVRGSDARLWIRQGGVWGALDGEVAGAPAAAGLVAGSPAFDVAATRSDGSVWLRRITPPVG